MHILCSIIFIEILIIVHELGHFLVAIWCNERPISFNIGVGPALITINIMNVPCSLRCILVGGYVELDEKFMDEIRWSKYFLIKMAGPAFNLVVSLLIYIALWIMGAGIGRVICTNEIGDIPLDSILCESHVYPGSTISVEDMPSEDFSLVQNKIRFSAAIFNENNMRKVCINNTLSLLLSYQELLKLAPRCYMIRQVNEHPYTAVYMNGMSNYMAHHLEPSLWSNKATVGFLVPLLVMRDDVMALVWGRVFNKENAVQNIALDNVIMSSKYVFPYIIAEDGSIFTSDVSSEYPDVVTEYIFKDMLINGVQDGDVIIGLNGQIVNDSKDIAEILDQDMVLSLWRKNTSHLDNNGENNVPITDNSSEQSFAIFTDMLYGGHSEYEDYILTAEPAARVSLDKGRRYYDLSRMYGATQLKRVVQIIANPILYFFSEVALAFWSTIYVVKQLVSFSSSGKYKFSGIVGMTNMLSDSLSKKSFGHTSIFIASMSISLAIFNLIPLPILDGGVVLLWVVHLFGSKRLESVFSYIGMLAAILLVIFMCFTLYNDIYAIAVK